jgi:foldase protein PrsA
MRRRKRRIRRLLALCLVVVLMLAYARFFNGHIFYFTKGFEKNVLLETAGQSIYDYEARILYADVKDQYEALFGSDVWSRQIEGESFVDYAKEHVRTKLIRIACMNQMASERGVVLSRDENNNVIKAAREYMDKLTDSDKKKLSVTQEDIELMMQQFALAGRLYADMTGNLQIEISADDARVIKIQYVSCDTREAAENALAQINAGESFYQVAKNANGGGDYECELKRQQTDEAFEEAAFSLETGEMSGIVESQGRFYIIRCVSDNEKNKSDTNKNDMLSERKLEEFNKTFEKYEASLFVNVNEELFRQVDFQSLEGEVSFEEIFNKYFK